MQSPVDVLVLGCGAAGIGAVTGAAAKGVSVLAIEKNNYPGGKATAAFVGTVCGMYLTGNRIPPIPVVRGFPWEFSSKLMKLSKTQVILQKDGLRYFNYNRDRFMELADEYLVAGTGRTHYHSKVISAKINGYRIESVDIDCNGAIHTIHPKIVIDTTGEPTIAALTELPYITSDRYQAAALVFELSGLPDLPEENIRMALIRTLRLAVEQGKLDPVQTMVYMMRGTLNNHKALFKFGVPIEVKHNDEHIKYIEKYSRDSVTRMVSAVKALSGSFASISISFVAPETGIRTGPRYSAKAILSGEDVLTCARFEDAVARGAWPVESWAPQQKVSLKFFEPDNFYEIPAGCLQSDDLENLYFAGRNIAATDDAIASCRVIGTCLQTGYAAGILAAGTVLDISRENLISEIQDHLFVDEPR